MVATKSESDHEPAASDGSLDFAVCLCGRQLSVSLLRLSSQPTDGTEDVGPTLSRWDEEPESDTKTNSV